jgi:hypothetical protein
MDLINDININEIEVITGKKITFPLHIKTIFNYFGNSKNEEYTFNEFIFDAKYLLSLIKLFSNPVSDAPLEKSQSEYFRTLEKFLGIMESVRKNLTDKEKFLFDDSFSPSGKNFYENIVLLLSDLTAIKDYQLRIKS